MSAILQIDHVQLPVPHGGLAVARRYYEQALGLAELRSAVLDRPGTLRFTLGTQRLDLCEGGPAVPAPQAHLALQVDDLAQLRSRLRGAGFADDVEAPPHGRRAYVADPFGNRLELIEAAVRGATA